MEMWRGGGGSCRTRVLCAPSTPTLTSPSPFFLPFLSLFSHQLLARVTSTGSPPSTSATVRSGCCVPVPVSPREGTGVSRGWGGDGAGVKVWVLGFGGLLLLPLWAAEGVRWGTDVALDHVPVSRDGAKAGSDTRDSWGRGSRAMVGWQRGQRSQSSLRKGMKKAIGSFTCSPGEKSQPILGRCSRVKQGGVAGWGGCLVALGVWWLSAGLACTVPACFCSRRDSSSP